MMKNKKSRGRIFRYVVIQVIVLLLLVLTFSLMWAQDNYGSIGMDEILFTLNMPLKGTSDSLLNSYIQNALIPIIVVFAIELAVTWPRKNKHFLIFDYKDIRRLKLQVFPLHIKTPVLCCLFIVWMAVLVMGAESSFGLVDFVKNQRDQSELIEQEFVDPKDVDIQFPEKKRNLIYIFIESGESTNQDVANGGYFDVNYIPEMTEIAKGNISFSQSDQIEGAAVAPASGWTMAGLVAETAGLPLKLFKYDDQTGVDNSMGQYASFLPGAVTLGDILEDAGYRNYFMAGSDFEFGGRESYFTQHGSYEVWDYYTAIEEGKIPADYCEWWGFEDTKLYDYAKEQLLEISKEDTPFNFSMLTADTHHVAGYVCDLCENAYDDQYGNVWSCASRQLNDFVEWLKEQDFYENTTVVICGDHCSMDPDFYGSFSYDKHHGETGRKVYNAILNSAVEPMNEKNRKFTTMDMFPTVLAAMGVEIEGDRLNLGTNLFSSEETLSEKYGYEDLFEELNKKSSFYNHELLYGED
ncbi:sulfatase-like hydrolase/transferase [Frisingicoccus sp.]|uniref:sulfatase-like hydrolase/transferase n=1 Tax=Frisingicoccus sp. TaxID=1918627 RepID=UPI003867BFBC